MQEKKNDESKRARTKTKTRKGRERLKFRIFLVVFVILADLLILPKIVYNLDLLFKGTELQIVINNLTTFSVIYPWVILKQTYGTFYLILQGFVATALLF
jgi:type IV secretion system protein VirD4